MYTKDLGEEVCRRVADGQSLVKIIEELGLGGMGTIYDWTLEDGYFGENYARAREAQADAMDGKIHKVGEDVEAKKLDPASARVMLEAYKWRAERLKPKVYGAQGQVTHISTSQADLDRLSTDDLRAMKAKLLAPVIDQDGEAISPKPRK